MGKKNSSPPSMPTEAILESISDGVFTVDETWRITFFNRAAEKITGVSRKEALGRLCSEVFRSIVDSDGTVPRLEAAASPDQSAPA